MNARPFARLIVFMLLLVATPALAQELPAGDTRNAAFRSRMDAIVAANGPYRDYMKMPVGTEYVLPDGTREKLAEGDDHGIWGREFAKLYGTPYSTFLNSKTVTSTTPSPFPAGCTSATGYSVTTGMPCSTAAPTTKTTVEETPEVATASTERYQSPWLWWLLALAFLGGVIYAFVRRRKLETVRARERHASEEEAESARVITEQAAERERVLTQDPVTSGTPYVPGGIAPTEIERLENFFDRQAATRYAERNPGLERNTIRVTRIGPIEEGTISGQGLVGYLGGIMSPRRITNPIRAYQARYRFPDGTEEVLQCLQGCMNPVGYGGEVYRDFIFTPGQVAVPERPVTAPEPAPAPVPAAEVTPVPPASVPAVVEQSTSAVTVEEDGVVKFEVRRATDGQPAMVRMTGIDETANTTCEIRSGSVVLRFTPRQNTVA